jgi:hypothetical protein
VGFHLYLQSLVIPTGSGATLPNEMDTGSVAAATGGVGGVEEAVRLLHPTQAKGRLEWGTRLDTQI